MELSSMANSVGKICGVKGNWITLSVKLTLEPLLILSSDQPSMWDRDNTVFSLLSMWLICVSWEHLSNNNQAMLLDFYPHATNVVMGLYPTIVSCKAIQ